MDVTLHVIRADRLSIVFGMIFSALGGCWWPIEVTPDWMQVLQKMIPTGWTMDALHKLISFQQPPATALPHVLALLGAAVLVGIMAARNFRYE